VLNVSFSSSVIGAVGWVAGKASRTYKTYSSLSPE